MAGYDGYRMSNNALAAYSDGERPRSKWTKSEIIALCVRDGIAAEKVASLKKMPAEEVKSRCLYRSSWHHTSAKYNRTDFYAVDTAAIDAMDLSRPMAAVAVKSEKRSVTATYLVWSGTQKHPKATEVTEEGTIEGGWYTSVTGVRKSIKGRGFRLVE